MENQTITFTINSGQISEGISIEHEVDGLKCVWSYANKKCTWKFDWTVLKPFGVCGMSGYVSVKPEPYHDSNFNPMKVDVDLKIPQQTIEKAATCASGQYAILELSLTPYRNLIEVFDKMFLANEGTDAVLVIGTKKLHVCKAFLSFHSDFFRQLFSTNFKESQMTEIPIKDVSYEDFGLLMSTIYPDTIFPNDETAEKLIEMADRFLMPAVTRSVEHHLLYNSKLPNEKIIRLADQYRLEMLLNKSTWKVDSLAKLRQLKNTPEYEKLSGDTKAKILDRLAGP